MAVNDALVDALAGVAGGLFACVCLYPLDLIKTRVQAHTTQALPPSPSGSHAGLKPPPTPTPTPAAADAVVRVALPKASWITPLPPTFPAAAVTRDGAGGAGPATDDGGRPPASPSPAAPPPAPHAPATSGATAWEVLLRILATRGPAGLFDGLVARCAQSAAEDFVYFYAYSALKSALDRRRRRWGATPGAPLPLALSLLCGCCAGVVTCAYTIPLDVLATRLQTADRSAGQGVLSCLRDVAARGGPAAFWAGLFPSALLTSNPALNFALFDRLKWALRPPGCAPGDSWALPPARALALGAATKAAAIAATFPLIRLKVLAMHHGAGGGPRALLAALVAVLRREGAAGLYKGLGLQLAKSVLAAALLFATREQILAVAARARAGGRG